MKKTGWAATAAAAVVVVGGGIFAVQALTADPGGHTDFRDDTETAYTGSYEPVETETPVESVEPTEAVETPTPTEPVVATGPIEVSAEPTQEAELTGEALMQEIISTGKWAYLHVSDDEIMSLAQYVCEERDAGVPAESIEALTGSGITPTQNSDFVTVALRTLCPVD